MRQGLTLLLLTAAACRPEGRARLEVGPAECAGDPGAPPLRFTGPRPRNLLMFSLDTVRRDAVGRYGRGGDTPFLDALAGEGVVLDDHLQCSNWTYASVSCTLLGLSELDAGFVPRLSRPWSEPWPDAPRFLAEVLADAGYHTVLHSPNAWLSAEWNDDQGYAVSRHSGGTLTTQLALGLADLFEVDRPWFLHVHAAEPHAPYAPPAEYLGGLDGLPPVDVDLSVRDEHYDLVFGRAEGVDRDLLEQHLRVRYAGEIRWLDDQLRDAFATLEGAGLLDDTLVVVWTDHGEQFWEHGHQTHAMTLYAEENAAVAVLWARTLAPCAWSGPTHGVDLAPTILDALEVGAPAGMTGAVLGRARPDRERLGLSVARRGGVQALRVGNLKLHFQWSGGVRELFAVDEDPEERTDLFSRSDPVARDLWERLEPRVKRAAELAPDAELDLP